MGKPATEHDRTGQAAGHASAGSPGPGTAALQAGMAVRGIFVVKKKVRRDHGSGQKFLLFQFSDRTGSINGVLWDDAEAVSEQITAGDLVHVEGDVQLYQGARQIKVRRIVRADPSTHDLAEFLPRSALDPEAQFARLRAAVDTIREPHLQELCARLFADQAFMAAFRTAPAGKGWHHAHLGGLVEHVVAMLDLGAVLEAQHPALDHDLLFAGILVHDLGKVEEMIWRSHIEYTDAGRLVGHLVQGCMLLDRYIAAIAGFPAELRMRLLHIVISHHGSQERGSPKPPMTLEAMAVHLLDQLDSQVQAVAQVTERPGGEAGWSEHVKLLDRVFFRGRHGDGMPGTESPGA